MLNFALILVEPRDAAHSEELVQLAEDYRSLAADEASKLRGVIMDEYHTADDDRLEELDKLRKAAEHWEGVFMSLLAQARLGAFYEIKKVS